MSMMKQAVQAYAASAAHRHPRAQEAELFRRVNATLGRASDGPIARVRALADNDRLWTMVIGLVRDPDNALPESLRASLVSIGLAVRREMQSPSPDLPFLIGINENIAAGLSGHGDR